MAFLDMSSNSNIRLIDILRALSQYDGEFEYYTFIDNTPFGIKEGQLGCG